MSASTLNIIDNLLITFDVSISNDDEKDEKDCSSQKQVKPQGFHRVLDDDFSDIITLKSRGPNSKYYKISKKCCALSKFIMSILDSDNDTVSILFRSVKAEILEFILTYLLHHQGIEPKRIQRPIKSSKMNENVDDENQWDSKWIDSFDDKTLFEIVLTANYLDIASLLDLGCAKIATLIKKLDESEKNKLMFIINDLSENPDKIETEEYLLVKGYCANSLPQIIQNICIEYMFPTEVFMDVTDTDVDEEYFKYFKLSDDKLTITKIKEGELMYDPFNVFGENMINTDSNVMYRWDIKIENLNLKCGQSSYFVIGITNANTKYQDGPFLGDFNAISYIWTQSGMIASSANIQGNDYSKPYGEGDIVGIELNTQLKQLIFYKNNESQGIAFNEVETGCNKQYRIAIVL
eukprot:354279_1